MNRSSRSLRQITTLGLFLVLGPALAPLAGKNPVPAVKPLPALQLPPLPEEKTTPWGKEVDGLSCRLTVPAEVTHGQPIRAVLEIRNNSKVTRHLYDRLSPLYKTISSLRVTGPDGTSLPQTTHYATSPSELQANAPRRFTPLAAGESRRFDMADLRDLFASRVQRDGEWLARDSFHKDGKYTLAYTFSSPRMAASPKEQRDGVFTGTLESDPVTLAMRPIAPKDLTVHEWGVFSVFSDIKWANLNHREEWLTLPDVFYRQFPTCRLTYRPAVARKPIVYFYTGLPSLEIDVRVKFTEGAPVVWWPACASPFHGFGAFGADGRPLPRPVFNALRWSGWLGDAWPSRHGYWSKAEDYKLPPHAWLQNARLPDASRFTVLGMAPQGGIFRPETERFIYYDGLVPAPDNLRCTAVTEAAVTVKNTGKFPIAHLFLIDRRRERPNKDWAVTYRAEPIPPGSEASIPLQAVRPATESPELKNLATAARRALLATGLYQTEADSILKIWHKDFFDADGLTALWLLPQAEYDRMLPLEVTPAPANRPIRVGIIHQPRFDMGLRGREQVAQLIRRLDSKAFSERDAASRELEELGPWVVPQVREALTKKPSLEITRRLEALLQKVDASEWLKQTVPGPKAPAK